MAKRRKRNKRISKTKSISLSYDEAPTEQRKKFPKKLIDAFINLDKTKTKEPNAEYYEWTEKAYELYRIEAKKYLGSLDDPIKSGRLVVRLSKATRDLCDGKTKKTQKEKQTEET